MTDSDLSKLYRDYIDTLNRRDLMALDRFVRANVSYNGMPVGLDGYRDLLRGNFRDIPDLRFRIEILVVEAPYVASRLAFECTPTGSFLDLPVNGRTIAFAENVFYAFVDGKIADVRSVVDKFAIEAQLSGR